MLSTSNVAVQFGAKPLFEQVTVKFSDGNRYGLIGANGSGKSTLMKVLGGDLDASAGDVMLQVGMRLGKLNQNQFGYEDERVLDVVMRGHTELWTAMQERDRIYADPKATDEDYMKAAELEGVFAEYGGYDAEARAGSILTDAGISEARHNGPMRDGAGYINMNIAQDGARVSAATTLTDRVIQILVAPMWPLYTRIPRPFPVWFCN